MMYTRGYKVYGRRGNEPLTLALQVGGGRMRLVEPRRTGLGFDVLYEFPCPVVRIEGHNLHWKHGLFSRQVFDWYVTIYDKTGIVALRCMSEWDARAIKRYAERMAQRREKRKGRA
ncbi:MAG: hypothetical protein HFJ75_00200 [Eggerthellaceae bacterium]|nr:hypothetical protein [Eggerthellaceae bacterium]